TFLFLDMSPGDFFQEMKLNPQITQSTVDRFRIQYGMDQPLSVHYGRWLRSMAHGDFGYSFAYNSPVAPLLWVRSRNTLFLPGTGMLFAWPVALLVGGFCAEWSGGWLDRICLVGTSIVLVIPELLLGLCFLAIAVRTGWFRTGGMVSADFKDLNLWEKVEDLV